MYSKVEKVSEKSKKMWKLQHKRAEISLLLRKIPGKIGGFDDKTDELNIMN